MRIRVGPYVYRVRITDEPLKDEQGGELLGLAVYKSREILISPTVPAEQRYETLLHEVRHAFGFHFPTPTTEEEECNYFATMTQSLMMDLEEQGGRLALERMKPSAPFVGEDPVSSDGANPQAGAVETKPEPRLAPVSIVNHTEAKGLASGKRAQCATCGTIVCGGQVASSPVRFDGATGGRVVERTLYCQHCDHVQSWLEGVDFLGNPNGQIVKDPWVKRGEEAEEFLRLHPEGTGVLLV